MRLRVVFGVSAFLAGASFAHACRRPPPAAVPARKPEPHFARILHATEFARGNLHAHTLRSDGDASPESVVRWYAAHGYDFVALTDHNVRSTSSASRDGASITTLAGEEVSMRVQGRQVHVNALCTRTLVAGGDFPDARTALAHAVGDILDQGGVALINHPNFDWALTSADVSAADGEQLLEIASGHPYVHSSGDATRPSHEALWDAALTAGHDVMGVAVDDAHHLVTDADPEAFPGMAWVDVFVAPAEAEPEAICEALRRGALYASTGAEVTSLDVGGATYTVRAARADAIVTFVGAAGRVLARAVSGPAGASYHVVGDEGYVRTRVETTAGLAWTPAVRVTRD